MHRFSILTFFTLLAVSLSACNFSLAADVTPPPGYQPPPPVTQEPVNGPLYPLVAPDVVGGAGIYAEKCTPCHGEAGMGDGPRSSELSNPVAPLGAPEFARQASPTRWYQIVTQGNLEKFMPPFRSLSDRERWDVVAYSFNLSAPTEQLDLGRQVYEASCARCHGESGKGDGPDAAALGQKPRDLNSLEYLSSKSSADFYNFASQGIAPDMPAFAKSLSEEELWLVSDYLRSWTFQPAGMLASGSGQVSPQAEETGTASVQSSTQFSATLGVTATAVAAAPVGFGTVRGLVSNASGGEVPANLTVTLQGYDHMTPVFTTTTTTQADGSYVFEGVELPAGRIFLTLVDYNGATYGSDIGQLQAGQTELELPISIFETTSATDDLRIDRLHLFMDFEEPEQLRVVELYIISNNGESTVVPDKTGKPVLNFTLPAEATNLEFQDGELGGKYVQTENGFGDVGAIRPGAGAYQVLYSYLLPYKSKLDLELAPQLGTDAVVVLVPEGSIKVRGEGIQDDGSREVENITYHMYNRSGVNAGEKILLSLSGKPASASGTLSAGSTTNLVVGLGAFGLALVAAGAWLWQRSRSVEADDEDEEEELDAELEGGDDSAESLMDAILALDDLYREGQLSEEAYQQRRAELKERLARSMGH
jgi:mono/diheme cytochrome c family protein